MVRRAAFLMGLAVLLFTLSAHGAAIGPEFLIRVDLNDQTDFRRAEELGLEPVYRWGNDFYFVLDGRDLMDLESARLSYTAIDTDPFAAGVYYYIDADSPVSQVDGPARRGAQPIDQIAGATLWKSPLPLYDDPMFGGDAPRRLTAETVPLTYMQPLTQAVVSAGEPMLDTVAARVLADSLVAYDTRLVNFGTRYVYTNQNRNAQSYLVTKLQSFGYTDVAKDTFTLYGWDAHNIICTKLGDTEPDKVIIVGAHFDSWNQDSDPYVFAPGADDNGSGTSGVLEIARVLADLPTRKTIIFVPFDAEEVGLVGSAYYAGQAQANGMDIELMINMDMIGWEPNTFWNVWLNTSPASMAYAKAAEQFALTRTGLTPSINPSPGGSSDHASFSDLGYRIVYAAEGDFNTPGWHRDADLVATLNPPYWADVVRMVAMTAYATAQSPSPVESVALWDVGDGASLEVRWAANPAGDITGYDVAYGTASGVYTDTVTVSGGNSTSVVLSGLTEGTTYYVAVGAVAANGWSSLARTEVSLAPLSQPRVPGNLFADVELGRILLSWDSPVELDFDHYALYRGIDSLALSLYVPNVAGNAYVDYSVSSGVRYYYQVVSVDQDANASAPSATVSAVPATFDKDILIVDLTDDTPVDPTEPDQLAVYDAMFGAYQHGYYRYDDYDAPIEKSELGQYGTVYWIDDDQSRETWPADHWAKLNWYLDYGNNVVVCGWMTPDEMNSSTNLNSIFGVGDVTRVNPVDCLGGLGEAGFPDVVFDTAKVYSFWNGVFGYLYTLTPGSGTPEVIMRYNSATDDPAREVLPVAIRHEYGGSKVAVVALPLYYLRQSDAMAMITAFAAWFGQAPAAPGDINGDGFVDAIDVGYAVDVVFRGMFPPTGYGRVDVNADCVISVVDVVYLIDHVFRGGAAPLTGCLP